MPCGTSLNGLLLFNLLMMAYQGDRRPALEHAFSVGATETTGWSDSSIPVRRRGTRTRYKNAPIVGYL